MVQSTNIPGNAGASAFTVVTTAFVTPAISGQIQIDVENSETFSIGQNIFVENSGYYVIVSLPSDQLMLIEYLDLPENTESGNNVPVNSKVSPGSVGTAGTDGSNAFTVTSANFTCPAIGAQETVSVADSTWMTVGQNVFVQTAGNFEVIAKPSSVTVTLEYLDYVGNTHATEVIASGSQVSPSGTQPDITPSLPTALTDNTTGTASNTLAAGTGIFTLAIPITLAQITGSGDVLTTYTLGFAFKILSVDCRVVEAVTTAGDSASLNLEIGAVDVTGGVVALTSANATPLGAAIAGSAVTGTNTGTAADTISVEASSVTAFAEGAVVLLVRIQNMDTANAVASLADHINDLITALTP